MWELDCEESWAPKNWCFWTVVLEKTLESPLDCKEIQPVHPKGDQPWVFFGRNDAKAETLATSWEELTHWKRLWCWKGLGQEEKGMTEDEMAGWHHRLDWCESEWTPGDGDGQGGLACCNSWGCKESDTTERLNWTELLYNIVLVLPHINMNWPWVYMCSPSWNPLPPPSPYPPSRSSQCTSPKHPVSCIEPGPAIHFTYDNTHVSMPFSQIIPPRPLPHSPKDCSIHLCLSCCLAYRVIVTIFLNSIYMH